MAQKHSTQDRYDTYELYQKRLEILIGGKWRDRSALMSAAQEQDRIRIELSKKLKGWDSTAEIRKWRETRCSA
jgi:hypothetical protein